MCGLGMRSSHKLQLNRISNPRGSALFIQQWGARVLHQKFKSSYFQIQESYNCIGTIGSLSPVIADLVGTKGIG